MSSPEVSPEEAYKKALEVVKRKFPKLAASMEENGRYVPRTSGVANEADPQHVPLPNMYSGPFPKKPKATMAAETRPHNDMTQMAKELMDQFNTDKYVVNGGMDFSLYSPFAVYKDPSYEADGIPVEVFPDASGMINDKHSDLQTLGEPQIIGNKIKIWFYIKMCMKVLPWSFFVMGCGTLEFTISDGLVVQVYEEYIDYATGKKVDLAGVSTFCRCCEPNFEKWMAAATKGQDPKYDFNEKQATE